MGSRVRVLILAACLGGAVGSAPIANAPAANAAGPGLSSTSPCSGPAIQALRAGGALIGSATRDCEDGGPFPFCRSHVAAGSHLTPGPGELHFYRNDGLVFEVDGPSGVLEHLAVTFNGQSHTAAVAPFTSDVTEERGVFGNVRASTGTGTTLRTWTTAGSTLGSGTITFTLDGGSLDVVIPEVGGNAPLHLSGAWRDPPGCGGSGVPPTVAAAPATSRAPAASAPIPRTTSRAGGSLGTVLFITVAAVVLAGLLVEVLRRRKTRRRPPRCHCDCTVFIRGPDVVRAYRAGPTNVPSWSITGSDVGATLFHVRADGSQREAATFTADWEGRCEGGAAATPAVSWAVMDVTDTDLTVAVTVRVEVHCADGTTTETSCRAQLTVAIAPEECGPDITDGFLGCLNRILERFRVMDATHTVSGTVFLASTGLRMIYRPLAPATWGPQATGGRCPSCRECADTVTFLGVCVDPYVTGDFLFGFCAGYLEVPGWVRDVGGDLAKKARGLATNPDREVAESIWPIAAEIGRRCAQTDATGGSATVSRGDLSVLLPILRVRRDCAPCVAPGPTAAFKDFSLEKWNT